MSFPVFPQVNPFASEEHYRHAFFKAATGINVATVAGKFIEANPAYCRMLGYTEEELREIDIWSLTHPDDLDISRELRRELIEGRRENYVLEKRYLRKNGGIVWSRVTVSLIRDSSGKPISTMGVAEDITERRRAEQTLQESEERFRLLSKATNDAIWDWDILTGHLWWNEGYRNLFGYLPEETDPTIKSWKDHVHPDDRDRAVGTIHQVIEEGGQSWTDEYRFERRDGSYAYVLDRGYVIRDDTGKPVRMVGGMTDLTQRKQYEQQLTEQAALLDNAHEAILVKDLEGRIIYWNKGAERTYGWTSQEILGRKSVELLFKDPSRFNQAYTALMANGEWQGELQKNTKDGREITVEVSFSLVRDGNGNPKSILAITADITERKKLEQQYLRAQRLESIGTLAGGIAHDLNNMLAPILMSLEMLKMKFPDEQALSLLDTLQASAQHGADLVKQVLSFARGVEGERVIVNPFYIMRDIQKIASDTFPKSVAFEMASPKDLWTVTGDPTQLHQVFLNLCVNARDAMPDGGHLTVSLKNIVIDRTYAAMNQACRPGSYVMIEVADTGTGIPPEVMDKIFEPFFTTKEVGQGTGLGLSTSLGIVKSHGGFINLYSEPGKGTRFQVHLPANAPGEIAQEVVIEKTHIPRGDGELILVVDDEASIRKTVQGTLESFGYRVMLASHGAEAVSHYVRHQEEIAAVLTDMAMPIMDGPSTIIALKSIHPAIKIIGSSGFTSNDSLAKAIGAGVEFFVPKPYTADVLLRTLHQVLHTS